MKALRLALLILAGLSLLVLTIQNWNSVPIVVAGQISTLPLSIALLAAYALGAGLGALILGIWVFHDRLLLKQADRQLARLTEQLDWLENEPDRQDYLLPGDRVENDASQPDRVASPYSYGFNPTLASEDDDWDHDQDSYSSRSSMDRDREAYDRYGNERINTFEDLDPDDPDNPDAFEDDDEREWDPRRWDRIR